MLYQSYDNYAGASGFYDPSQDQQPQQTGSATPVTAASPPKFPVPAPPGGVVCTHRPGSGSCVRLNSAAAWSRKGACLFLLQSPERNALTSAIVCRCSRRSTSRRPSLNSTRSSPLHISRPLWLPTPRHDALKLVPFVCMRHLKPMLEARTVQSEQSPIPMPPLENAAASSKQMTVLL
jgi:hypothetical protein